MHMYIVADRMHIDKIRYDSRPILRVAVIVDAITKGIVIMSGFPNIEMLLLAVNHATASIIIRTVQAIAAPKIP